MPDDRPKKFRYLTHDEFDELSVPEKVAYLEEAVKAHKVHAPRVHRLIGKIEPLQLSRFRDAASSRICGGRNCETGGLASVMREVVAVRTVNDADKTFCGLYNVDLVRGPVTSRFYEVPADLNGLLAIRARHLQLRLAGHATTLQPPNPKIDVRKRLHSWSCRTTRKTAGGTGVHAPPQASRRDQYP